DRFFRVVYCYFFFFFSSRRRHTRFDCDWSSDVCSSDLRQFDYKTNERLHKALELKLFEDQKDTIKLTSLVSNVVDASTQEKIDRSEERRVGKECRSRWSPEQ